VTRRKLRSTGRAYPFRYTSDEWAEICESNDIIFNSVEQALRNRAEFLCSEYLFSAQVEHPSRRSEIRILKQIKRDALQLAENLAEFSGTKFGLGRRTILDTQRILDPELADKELAAFRKTAEQIAAYAKGIAEFAADAKAMPRADLIIDLASAYREHLPGAPLLALAKFAAAAANPVLGNQRISISAARMCLIRQ
jgi:hypothetical protein